ncbi:TPA: DUF551 domain-containing protein [Enterobacter cloacae]
MTFTKEQLRERAREKVKSLEFAVTQTAFADSRAELEGELELARIALASLEAEASGRNPVLAYADSYRNMANHGVESIPVWSVITDLERNIAPLFTAPPAPISVPAAMEMDDDFDSSFEHGKAVGWNACRNATLQGSEPVSNRDELPDGWVACSERMPVENDIVLVVDDGYFVCEAQYREGDFYSAVRGGGEFFETTCRDVELWQPMPAPPQQEVK